MEVKSIVLLVMCLAFQAQVPQSAEMGRLVEVDLDRFLPSDYQDSEDEDSSPIKALTIDAEVLVLNRQRDGAKASFKTAVSEISFRMSIDEKPIVQFHMHPVSPAKVPVEVEELLGLFDVSREMRVRVMQDLKELRADGSSVANIRAKSHSIQILVRPSPKDKEKSAIHVQIRRTA